MEPLELVRGSIEELKTGVKANIRAQHEVTVMNRDCPDNILAKHVVGKNKILLDNLT